MSAQSLLRSNGALKTARALQPSTGWCGPRRYEPHFCGDLGVEAVDVEEEVDRGVLPPDPGLPVALGGLDVGIGDCDAGGQRGEDLAGPVGAGEHVDVEVARARGFSVQ